MIKVRAMIGERKNHERFLGRFLKTENRALSALLFVLLLAVCNKWMMAGAPAAILDHEVTWKLEAMLQR